MAIWYQLKKAGEPGLTLEQLIPLMEPGVPVGYAWRRYIRGRSGIARAREEATPHLRASAIKWLVRSTVYDMVRYGLAIKRPNGSLSAGRMPKSAMASRGYDDDLDGSATRHHVEVMEAMRVIRPWIVRSDAAQLSRVRGSHVGISYRVYEAVKILAEAMDKTGKNEN